MANELEARVTLYRSEKQPKLRAMASLRFGETYVVNGLKVMDGSNGLFVAMPGYKSGDEFKETFHAITKEGHKTIQSLVLAKYNEALKTETANAK